MITKLSQIVEEAQKKGRKRLAVAYGQDSHTLSAVYDAYNEGLVEPTLYGDKQVIEEVCGAEGIDCSIFKIVDEKSDVNCVRLAVAAVVAGDADVLMKGLVSTDKYMRGILNKDAGQTARLLGIDTPKIACIAPSEQVLPSVPSSTEGAILAKMGDRGQLGNAIVDGPLSLDVALYKEVAEHKKVKGSAVAGDPDCLLFPNIESANVFFKAATHFGGAELAAMVMGTKVPCVLTSRGDSRLTKMYSIALACLAAR